MGKKFDPKDYRAKKGLTLAELKAISTHEEENEKDMRKLVEKNLEDMDDLQRALYAEAKQSVLFVFQAMDAAGKDSTIRQVFSGLDPQGIQVNSFKKPSDEELAHDYLWRVHKRTPARGHIGIFNRSHYEEVLVTQVHPNFIVYQNLPGINSVEDITPEFWTGRHREIANFESLLHNSGCKVVKFFLYVSLDEQKRRLISRMDVQEKNWKVKLRDTEERAYWEQYLEAYADAIANTHTDDTPWYIVPADHKWTMRAIVSSIAKAELESLNPQYPTLSAKGIEEMNEARNILENE